MTAIVDKSKQPLRIANLMAVTNTGDIIRLDTTKVMVVDVKSGKPIFKPQEAK